MPSTGPGTAPSLDEALSRGQALSLIYLERMLWGGRETGTNHLHTQRHLFEYQLEAAQFLGGWSGPSLAGTTGDRCFAQAGGGAQPELGVGSGQWAAQGLPVSIPHGTPPRAKEELESISCMSFSSTGHNVTFSIYSLSPPGHELCGAEASVPFCSPGPGTLDKQ